MKTEYTNKYGAIYTKFNGSLWLARHRFYSEQFLGSGKTENEAIYNMNNTIKTLKIKARLEPYFDKDIICK